MRYGDKENKQSNKKIASVGKDMGILEISCIAGRDIK